MAILAIDSAMNGCGVGFHDFDENLHFSEVREMSRGQAEFLMPMIMDVLGRAKKDFVDISCIAVTHGPGAFTGVRIAMACAKSLSIALNIPVIGISTFDAVFRTFENKATLNFNFSSVAVLLETKRKDYYFKSYSPTLPEILGREMCLEISDIKPVLCNTSVVVGDANTRLKNELEKFDDIIFYDVFLPDSRALAELVREKQINKNNRSDCNPVYLRPPDISFTNKKNRILK